MCKITFWACSRDHLERSDWSRDMFLLAGRKTWLRSECVRKNVPPWENQLKSMRSLIVDDILSGGGNVSTKYYPRPKTGSKYKVSGVTVSNVWKTFCQTGGNLPLHAAARGQPKRLTESELDQLLIKCRPIEAQSMATASISTMGRAVRDRLPERKISWKKMMRPAGENVTSDNQVG